METFFVDLFGTNDEKGYSRSLTGFVRESDRTKKDLKFFFLYLYWKLFIHLKYQFVPKTILDHLSLNCALVIEFRTN